MNRHLLITGATGFVGKAVCEQAVHHGLSVIGALRIRVEVPSCIEPFVVGEINVATDWGTALRDVNVIVHLAARVHVMHDTATDPMSAFRVVNVGGTLNLVRQAAANQTFLVSDGQDLSTTELVRGMAQAAGLPVWALQAGASLLGMGDAVQRLCGNLQVDISKARSLLGWVPPVSVEEGLRRAITS